MVSTAMVMYLGKAVETGDVHDILKYPRHPYPKGLLRSIPQIGLKEKLAPIRGSVPSMRSLPKGCCFPNAVTMPGKFVTNNNRQ